MLSGKAFVPGMGIESSCGVVARTVKLSTKTKIASSDKYRTRLEITLPMQLSIEKGLGRSDLVAFKQHEIVERISSGQCKSPRSVVCMNPHGVQMRQLHVQRKMLNLKDSTAVLLAKSRQWRDTDKFSQLESRGRIA